LLQRLSFESGNPIFDEQLQEDVQLTAFRDPFGVGGMPLPPQDFQQAARLVLFTDASYIILCPGDEHRLLKMVQSAGSTWKKVPFVADTRELSLIMRLRTDESMRLDRGEAIPAIMEYDGSNHIVDFGRGYLPFANNVNRQGQGDMATSNY
jgi:hypothetical protein